MIFDRIWFTNYCIKLVDLNWYFHYNLKVKNKIRMILPFQKKFNSLNSINSYNNQNEDNTLEKYYDYYDNAADSPEEDVVYNLYGR